MLKQNQIYELEHREQKGYEVEKDLDWFLEELKGIQEFKPDKERIEFRLDIFSRIVEKANGNEKMAWWLRKKGKPRKKK